MNWLIDVFLALLFTGITGSALLIFWYLIGRCMDRWGHISVLYRFLQIIPFFFLFPLLHLAIWFYSESDGATGTLFLSTPEILSALELAAEVWAAGFCIMVGYVIWTHVGFRVKNRLWLENDQKLMLMLEENKKLLGIKRNVRIRQSYGTNIPMVGGVFRPVIWIPAEQFTDEELKITLIHELTHLNNGDCLIRVLAIITRVVHWFNPLAWIPYILINCWGEYACDYKACDILGSSEKYFQVIAKMACKESGIALALFMPLFEDKRQVVRRMERMARYKQIKKKRPVLAAGVACMMLVASTVTVFGAAEILVAGYEKVYDSTVVEVEEVTNELNDYNEYSETETDSKIRIEEDTTANLGRASSAFIDWSVGNNVLKRTSTFSASSGDSIWVSVTMDPSDKILKVGIITPGGTKRYVTGSDSVTHEFSLTESGKYRVFVENTSGVSVDVSGSYKVK